VGNGDGKVVMEKRNIGMVEKGIVDGWMEWRRDGMVGRDL